MCTDNRPADTCGYEPMVWLWTRKPDSTDLQRIRIPAAAVPSEWLPLLQIRYVRGDRVIFTFDTDNGCQLGTIVQDQGTFVAVDGDAPGTAYTLHKSDIRPESPRPQDQDTAALPSPAEVVSPRRRHTVIAAEGSLTACWDVGDPDKHGWQAQARLTATYLTDEGFIGTVDSVLVRQNDSPRERQRPIPPIVVHYQQAHRFSTTRLRDSLRAAVTAVRDAVDHHEPAVVAHFTRTTSSSAPEDS